MEKDMEIWALLEIHHDSDEGSSTVDFDHGITLFGTQDAAIEAKTVARRRVLNLPIADTNKVEIDDGDMVVLSSDDWWQWKIFKINGITAVPRPEKKIFTVRHERTVARDYEIEAESREEAELKLSAMIDAGRVLFSDGSITVTGWRSVDDKDD